jgi:DNA-binding NarL/FixJ family response regulator
MGEERTINVFHADRSAHIFMKYWHKFLKGTGISVLGSANNAKDMMAGLANLKPDLLLTAHLLCDEEAGTFLPKIKEKFPTLKILMLTMAYDKYHLLKYRQYLDGMMGKCDEISELIAAIRTIVMEDKIYYSFDIRIDGESINKLPKNYAKKRMDLFDSIDYESES